MIDLKLSEESILKTFDGLKNMRRLSIENDSPSPAAWGTQPPRDNYPEPGSGGGTRGLLIAALVSALVAVVVCYVAWHTWRQKRRLQEEAAAQRAAAQKRAAARRPNAFWLIRIHAPAPRA